MKKFFLAVAIAIVIFTGVYLGYMKYMNSYKGDGDYCLINEKGEVVTNLRIYDTAYTGDGDFGGALVILENRWPREDDRYKKACALLDPNGKIVLGPIDKLIRYNGQGLFSDIRHLYDDTGTKVGKLEQLGIIGTFGNNGLAPIDNFHGDSGFGYIDTTGNYVIESRFKAGGDFADNGLAAVQNEEELWGYIDEKGNYVIEPQFIDAGMFSDGLAPVEISDGNWAYIRGNGEIAFEVNCKNAGEFLNGCAVISENNQIDYLINIDGKRIGNEEYYYISNSSNLGIIRAQKDGRYCFIGVDGNPIFEKTFNNAWDFSRNGLCAVRGDNGLWGYIGTDGEWVIEPIYEYAYPFDSKGGVAVVKPVKQQN